MGPPGDRALAAGQLPGPRLAPPWAGSPQHFRESGTQTPSPLGPSRTRLGAQVAVQDTWCLAIRWGAV